MVTPRRILLVDDNADLTESLSMILQLSGHDARTATDGPSAIEAARSFDPELVVCDLGLPGMSGYEVATHLRALPNGPRMVLAALTGYGGDADRERTRRAGFDHHLVKPVDSEVIEQLAERL